MARSLVLYFSHKGENYFGGSIKNISKGNTEVAAELVQQAVGGDLFEIVPAHDYPVNYQECCDMAKEEHEADARPELVDMPDVSAYDTIYLGYPNWWGTIPMPVATVLAACDFVGKTICPFCTNEGSGMGSSERDIKRLAPQAIVKPGLSIRGSEAARAAAKIAAWVA